MKPKVRNWLQIFTWLKGHKIEPDKKKIIPRKQKHKKEEKD
jgi:hypothetical protein